MCESHMAVHVTTSRGNTRQCVDDANKCCKSDTPENKTVTYRLGIITATGIGRVRRRRGVERTPWHLQTYHHLARLQQRRQYPSRQYLLLVGVGSRACGLRLLLRRGVRQGHIQCAAARRLQHQMPTQQTIQAGRHRLILQVYLRAPLRDRWNHFLGRVRRHRHQHPQLDNTIL